MLVMAKIFRPGPVCIPKVIKQPLGPVGVVGGGGGANASLGMEYLTEPLLIWAI